MGERARLQHSAWLTQSLGSASPYPRIPTRRVDLGGFNPLMRKERGRLIADRWWQGALDRVEALDANRR